MQLSAISFQPTPDLLGNALLRPPGIPVPFPLNPSLSNNKLIAESQKLKAASPVHFAHHDIHRTQNQHHIGDIMAQAHIFEHG